MKKRFLSVFILIVALFAMTGGYCLSAFAAAFINADVNINNQQQISSSFDFDKNEIIKNLKSDLISNINKDLIKNIKDYKLSGPVNAVITFSDGSLVS